MGIVGDSAWEAAGLGDTVYPLFCRVVANLTRALSLTGTPSPGNLDTAVMIMAGDSIEIVTASTPHEWCVTHINASAHGVAPRAQDDADGVLHNLLGRTVGRNADGTLGVFVSVDAMRSARYVLIATAKRVCLAVRH